LTAAESPKLKRIQRPRNRKADICKGDLISEVNHGQEICAENNGGVKQQFSPCRGSNQSFGNSNCAPAERVFVQVYGKNTGLGCPAGLPVFQDHREGR
jgi:hypothetical protein